MALDKPAIFPWQSALWQRLMGMRDRLPHAFLLHGRQGVGKLAFAQAMAASLLCESPQPDGAACGTCLSCGWLAQGNHPDFRQVEPEDRSEGEDEAGEGGAAKTKKKSRFITVDQIRALGDLVGLSSHRHGLRVIILQPAETLNANAANALLKVLEEPPPATVFILLTHQLQRLLPTILSRCHKVVMPVPGKEESLAWLKAQGVADPAFGLAFTGGTPLAALEADTAEVREEVESLTQHLKKGGRIDALAIGWGRSDFAAAIDILQKWMYDLSSLILAGKVRYFPEHQSTLQGMAKSVDLPRLLDFQRTLAEARAQAAHPLNVELQLEALLLRYAQLFPSPARP
jgi:DNA polymerase-3 subunit delta'